MPALGGSSAVPAAPRCSTSARNGRATEALLLLPPLRQAGTLWQSRGGLMADGAIQPRRPKEKATMERADAAVRAEVRRLRAERAVG